jgi:protein-tyrosine phosphatase
MFELLFVCTGNICRSPTAHLIAASRLPGERFRVRSAGTYGLHGYPVEPAAARLLEQQGIACDAFAATRLDADLVEAADLVLTMTREHRTAVVTVAPRALPRTFTLREFARLVAGAEPVDDPRDLVAVAAAQRGKAWSPPEQDDVADPYGLGAAAYQRAYDDISEALARPLALLAGTTLGP